MASTARLADFPEIVETPGARLAALATAAGVTNLPGAAGVPMRDLPLLFRCRDRVVPGFVVGNPRAGVAVGPVGSERGNGFARATGRRPAPAHRRGRARAARRRAFGRVNRLSLDDLPLLVVGQATPEARAAAGRMRGGVVIVGRTDSDRAHPAAAGRPGHQPGGSLRLGGGEPGGNARHAPGVGVVGRGDHRRLGLGGRGRWGGGGARSSALRAAWHSWSTRWWRWPCSRAGGSGCPCALPVGLTVLAWRAGTTTLRGTACSGVLRRARAIFRQMGAGHGVVRPGLHGVLERRRWPRASCPAWR